MRIVEEKASLATKPLVQPNMFVTVAVNKSQACGVLIAHSELGAGYSVRVDQDKARCIGFRHDEESVRRYSAQHARSRRYHKGYPTILAKGS